MSNKNKVRIAHGLLDEINARQDLTPEQTEVLRSFLPERPKRKTAEELCREVYDVWAGTIDNEWPDDMYCNLENWLYELHVQLQGLAPAAPAHPEFLETEADYAAAPDGTIVASAENLPCHKFQFKWSSVDFIEMKDNKGMSRARRRVLRWGK